MRLVAPLAHLGDEDRGVVVAPLRGAVELPAPIQERRNARHAVGPVERHLERPHRIPREFVAEDQMDDALAVPLGIQPLDLTQVVEASHASPYVRQDG